MHCNKVSFSFKKSSTISICLHWVLFGVLLCQETNYESALKKSKRERLSNSGQPIASTVILDEFTSQSHEHHSSSPKAAHEHSLLDAVDELALILLASQSTTLLQSHHSSIFHPENSHSSHSEMSHVHKSSLTTLSSSPSTQTHHNLISSTFISIQNNANNSITNLSENNDLMTSAFEKVEEKLESQIQSSDYNPTLSSTRAIFTPESSSLETSSNFVFSFSPILKENSVSRTSISVTDDLVSIFPISITELLSLQHKQDIPAIKSTVSVSKTEFASSCATEVMMRNPEESSNVPNVPYSKKNDGFLTDSSCVISKDLRRQQHKNKALDYTSISQVVNQESKYSSPQPVQFLKDENTVTAHSSSVTPHMMLLKTETFSPFPNDFTVSSSVAEILLENSEKMRLQASFLETSSLPLFNSERLIEITPSLATQRSSKEVIFKSIIVEDKTGEDLSSEMPSQTITDQPYTIINSTDIEDNQNISLLLRAEDIEPKKKNKTSRNDNPHLDDIISGILHLIAGDVKLIRPPAHFQVPYSSVPVFRPTKSSSTRINNRGPPSFISPSRTVVLFSQPDRPLVPRPVHPPTLWHVRPTDIHRPQVLKPIAETNVVNFPTRSHSPTRPENVYTSTSVVHLYKPLFNSHSNSEPSADLHFNGDMLVSVGKPTKDKQQSFNKGNTSQGVRIQQGVGTFEVFRPPMNDKYLKIPAQNSISRPSSVLAKTSSIINANRTTSRYPANVLGTTTDWAPLLEHPTKTYRPEMETEGGKLPNDHDIVIITQPTIFDLTVTNSIPGLQKTKPISQSISDSKSTSTKTASHPDVSISQPLNATTEQTVRSRSKVKTNLLSSSSLPGHRKIDNRATIKLSVISSISNIKPIVLSSFVTPDNFPSFTLTPSLHDSIRNSVSPIQSNYQTTRYSTKVTSDSVEPSMKYFKTPHYSSTNSLGINKSAVSNPNFELKSPPRRNSVTVYTMTSSKVIDRFNDRTLLGRPIVVPVDIEEVRPYVGAINPPPRQGPIPTSQNFPQGRPPFNESHVQVAQAGLNVNDNNRGGLSNLPTGKTPNGRIPTQRLRPNSPLVRIDSCIVGDETTCNGKLNETCKSQLGISSCQCRAGFARMFIRGPCQPVVSIMLSVKLDRFENQKISFTPRYNDPKTEEYKLIEFEAKQALSSLFTYTVFGRHFLGVSVNKFYGIGSHLIANATIHLEENRLTRAPSMRLRIRQEVVQAIKQKNHNIGDSRLYADGPLNPVPAVEDINECADSNMNDCALDAICQNIFGTFQCICRAGFIDSNPFDERMSGRRCSACAPDYCSNHGICYVENGDKQCRCSGNYIGARCDIDSEVLGVAVGASVAAIIIILLTLTCLCVWNRRWKREQQRTEAMSARSVNSNQTFSYLNKLAKANTYRLTIEDRMRWAHISDVVSNLYAKPDVAGSNQNIGIGQSGYPDLIRCQSPTDDSLSWYNCGTRPRTRAVSYAQNQTAASFYDMNYPSQEMFMVPSHTAPRRNLNQNIQRTYYS